jgi:O-antigen ligase
MKAATLDSRFVTATPLADRALMLCLAVFPLFLLTLRGWMNDMLILAAILAVYSLIRNEIRMPFMPDVIIRRWFFLIVIALALPLVAVFLGQFFRQEYVWRNYDSPSRILLCIPVLFAITRNGMNVGKYLSYSVPLAVLLTLFSVKVHPDIKWGADRITTHFVDPLTFGNINLALGLFSLLSIDVYTRDTLLLKLYKLLGFAVGIYLSILSGSRTGWFSLPMVLFLWLHYRDSKNKWSTLALAIVGALAFSFAVYYGSSVVQHRVDLAVGEALAYDWDGLNKNSPEGMRISFFRIAWFLLWENPLGGWGDRGFKHLLNAPELAKFARPFAQRFVYNTGFHNEITTNMVRSGIWGLLSSCMLFFIPAVFFISRLHATSTPVRRLALLSLGYLICVFVSGMSTEVFNLKYTASFHAIMITCLSGSLLVSLQSDAHPKDL